jgi:hypothetical protein
LRVALQAEDHERPIGHIEGTRGRNTLARDEKGQETNSEVKVESADHFVRHCDFHRAAKLTAAIFAQLSAATAHDH